MSNEVMKLSIIKEFVDNQWDELYTIYKNNPPPHVSLHIPFELLRRIYKLEKALRILNKLILIIIERLHATPNIDIEEKETLFKNLTLMREKIVEQQWDIYDMEQVLKGKKDID